MTTKEEKPALLGRPPKRSLLAEKRKPGRPPKAPQVPSVIHIKLPDHQYAQLLYLKDELKIAPTISELIRMSVDMMLLEQTRRHGSLEKTSERKSASPEFKRIAGILQIIQEVQAWIGGNSTGVASKLSFVWQMVQDSAYCPEDWRYINVKLAHQKLANMLDEDLPYTDFGDKLRDKLAPAFSALGVLLKMYEDQGGEGEK